MPMGKIGELEGEKETFVQNMSSNDADETVLKIEKAEKARQCERGGEIDSIG